MKMLRKRYRGVAGKIVKYAETFEEDGEVYVAIRFKDNTALTFVVSPQTPRISTAELLKWKEGSSSVIRAYVKRSAWMALRVDSVTLRE